MANVNKQLQTRVRNFSAVTYLSQEQIQSFLQRYTEKIRNFALIYHDRDFDKIPHYHLLIVTHSAHTTSAVLRWFQSMGFCDDTGMPINTMCEPCRDYQLAYEYLYHKNNPEKFQYKEEEIICDDRSYFVAPTESQDDSMFQALDQMLQGVDFYTLAQRFGRDFILHYRSIRCLAEDIKHDGFLI